jgi:ribosomal protein S12 methylthiotransferase accessory factor
MVDNLELLIHVPEDFPEKYKDALVRSAELCAVKKHFESPPQIQVEVEAIPVSVA